VVAHWLRFPNVFQETPSPQWNLALPPRPCRTARGPLSARIGSFTNMSVKQSHCQLN
jgi:hypothetical protein